MVGRHAPPSAGESSPAVCQKGTLILTSLLEDLDKKRNLGFNSLQTKDIFSLSEQLSTFTFPMKATPNPNFTAPSKPCLIFC